jgi:type IV pilus assembly protein PilQ
MLQSLTMTLSKCLGVLLASLAISLPAWAGNALTSLDVSTGKNDSQVVKLAFKESLAGLPMHFATTNPSRIVLDFPGTDNGLAERSAGALNTGILGTYRVVRANDRTRVVINLTNPGTYDLRKDDKVLYLAVQGAQQAPGTAAPAQFAVKDDRRSHNIRDIDFRRSANGAGRVEVTLSDPGVGIDIKPKGQTIQIDFLNTSLPNALQRRLDVTEFATPAQTIETLEQGKTTRMTIKPKGRWEYSAYQTGRQFIVEISPMEVDNVKATDKDKTASYSGEKLSLDFQGQDVRSVLKIIADFTNLNIIAADSVNGNVTLRLKDVQIGRAHV